MMNGEFPGTASRKLVAERAALPFAILEQLNVTCGYERSFKMLDGKILANRYLLGVNLEQLTRSDLAGICRQLEMPADYIQELDARVSDANLVFFGFEDNEPGCRYKVYLEFWDKLKVELATKRNKSEPALLHLGFKWDPNDITRRTTSKYTCYPLLSTREMLSRMSDIYAAHQDLSSHCIAAEMVNYAASRAADRSFIYVEVDEDNDVRKSFDLNLYSAMVRLSDVQPALEKLRDRYSIPIAEFDRLYRLVANKLFGHLSGGVNRQGDDFLTMYFEP